MALSVGGPIQCISIARLQNTPKAIDEMMKVKESVTVTLGIDVNSQFGAAQLESDLMSHLAANMRWSEKKLTLNGGRILNCMNRKEGINPTKIDMYKQVPRQLRYWLH